LCSSVKTGGALNNPIAGPIAVGDRGSPIAISGMRVPEIYDAFVRPSIVEIARDARLTGSLICRVIASPKKTVIPTGDRKKVIEPSKLPMADVSDSFPVKILNGLGKPLIFFAVFTSIVL